MTHINKDEIGTTKEDIEKLLSKNTMLIIKEIKRTGDRTVEIFLVEPTLPQDFKGFVQRLVMIIYEMDAEEAIYRPEKNSITFWYD